MWPSLRYTDTLNTSNVGGKLWRDVRVRDEGVDDTDGNENILLTRERVQTPPFAHASPLRGIRCLSGVSSRAWSSKTPPRCLLQTTIKEKVKWFPEATGRILSSVNQLQQEVQHSKKSLLCKPSQ